MANIYQKTASDKTCILSPREGILRAFDFGDWTQIRLGFLWSGVGSGNDNAVGTAEILTTSGLASNWFTFGIKNSDTLDLPGFAGSTFIGINGNGFTDNRWDIGGSNQLIYSGAGTLRYSAMDGVTVTNGTPVTGIGPNTQSNPSGSTNYASSFVIRIDVQNRGLATQTVTMNTSNQNISSSTYGISELRSAINTYNNAGTTSSAIPWNTGVAAKTLPDAFYLRSPFYNNRIRMSAMMAIRYA